MKDTLITVDQDIRISLNSTGMCATVVTKGIEEYEPWMIDRDYLNEEQEEVWRSISENM